MIRDRSWAFDMQRPGEIELFFEFVQRTFDKSFTLRGATLSRLRGVAPRGGLSSLTP